MLMFLGKLCLKHTQDLQQNYWVSGGSFSVNIEHTVPVQYMQFATLPEGATSCHSEKKDVWIGT